MPSMPCHALGLSMVSSKGTPDPALGSSRQLPAAFGSSRQLPAAVADLCFDRVFNQCFICPDNAQAPRYQLNTIGNHFGRPNGNMRRMVLRPQNRYHQGLRISQKIFCAALCAQCLSTNFFTIFCRFGFQGWFLGEQPWRTDKHFLRHFLHPASKGVPEKPGGGRTPSKATKVPSKTNPKGPWGVPK